MNHPWNLIARSLPMAAAAVLLWPSAANAQIKQPGAHPDYVAELEPHLVLQWLEGPGWNDDVGFGLGFRATIPFFHNGPVKKINNNMGLTFGLDAAFFSGCEWGYWHYNWSWSAWHGDCSGSDWTFPVAMQWNFWLTPVVSVYGEPGFAISHERGTIELPPTYPGCDLPDGCEYDESHTTLEPVFWAGGRFLVSDSIGILVRLGIPYVSVGVGFLL
jgi:hypothetical protein